MASRGPSAPPLAAAGGATDAYRYDSLGALLADRVEAPALTAALLGPTAAAPPSDFVLAAERAGKYAWVLTGRARDGSWGFELSEQVTAVETASGVFSCDFGLSNMSSPLVVSTRALGRLEVSVPRLPAAESRLSLPATNNAIPLPTLVVPEARRSAYPHEVSALAASKRALPSSPARRNRPAFPGRGIRNSGANCYLSAVLVALHADAGLRSALALSENEPGWPVARAVHRIFRDIGDAAEGGADPQALLDLLRADKGFDPSATHDEIEFLEWLVEHLGPQASRRFAFRAERGYEPCSSCGTSSAPVSPSAQCFHAGTPIPPVPAASPVRVHPLPLAKLFPSASEREPDCCRKCKKPLGEVRWRLETLPASLVMAIGRRDWQLEAGHESDVQRWTDKLDGATRGWIGKVAVPETLRVVGEGEAGSRRYRLASAVFHTSVQGTAHKVAVVGSGGSWHLYDDGNPPKPLGGFEKAVNELQSANMVLRILVWCGE